MTLPSWMQDGACTDTEFTALTPAQCTGGGTLYSLGCPYSLCGEGKYEPEYGAEEGTLCKYFVPGDRIQRKHLCYLMNKLKSKHTYAREMNPSWGTRSNVCEFADTGCGRCTRGDVPDNEYGAVGGDREISELYATTPPQPGEIISHGNYGSGGTEYDEDICGDGHALTGVAHYYGVENITYSWRTDAYDLNYVPGPEAETINKQILYTLTGSFYMQSPYVTDFAETYDTGLFTPAPGSESYKNLYVVGTYHYPVFAAVQACAVRFVIEYLDIDGYVKISTNGGSVTYRNKRMEEFTTIELPLSLINGETIKIEIQSNSYGQAGVKFKQMQLKVPASGTSPGSWSMPTMTGWELWQNLEEFCYYDPELDEEVCEWWPGTSAWNKINGVTDTYTLNDIAVAVSGRLGYSVSGTAGILGGGHSLFVADIPPPHEQYGNAGPTIGVMPYSYIKESALTDAGKVMSDNMFYISRGLINLFNVVTEDSNWFACYDRTPPAISEDLSWFTDGNNLAQGTPIGGEYGTKNIPAVTSYNSVNMRDFVLFKRQSNTNIMTMEAWPEAPNTGACIFSRSDGEFEKIDNVNFVYKPITRCNYSPGYAYNALWRTSVTTAPPYPRVYTTNVNDYYIFLGAGGTQSPGLGNTRYWFNPLGIAGYGVNGPSYLTQQDVTNPGFLTNSIPVSGALHSGDATQPFSDALKYINTTQYTWSGGGTPILAEVRYTNRYVHGISPIAHPYPCRGFMAAGTIRNPRTFVIKKLYLKCLYKTIVDEEIVDAYDIDPVQFPDEVELVENDQYVYCKFTGRMKVEFYDENNYELKETGVNEFKVYSRTNPESGEVVLYKLRVNYLENPCPYGECTDATEYPTGWYVPRLSWGPFNFSAHPQGRRNVKLCDPTDINEVMWFGINPTCGPERIDSGQYAIVSSTDHRSPAYGSALSVGWNTELASGSLFGYCYSATEIWRMLLWLREHAKFILVGGSLDGATSFLWFANNDDDDFYFLVPWNWTDDISWRQHTPNMPAYVFEDTSGHSHTTRYGKQTKFTSSDPIQLLGRMFWNVHEVVRSYVTLTADQLKELTYMWDYSKHTDPAWYVYENIIAEYYTNTFSDTSRNSLKRLVTYKGRCAQRCLFAYEKTDGTYCRRSVYGIYDSKPGLYAQYDSSFENCPTNIEISNRKCPNPNFCGGTICVILGDRTGPTEDIDLYYAQEDPLPAWTSENSAYNIKPWYELTYYAADASNPRKHLTRTPVINKQTTHPFNGTETIDLTEPDTTLHGYTMDYRYPAQPSLLTRVVKHNYVWLEITAQCDMLEIYEGTQLLRQYLNVDFDHKRIDFVSYYPSTVRLVVTNLSDKWGARVDSMWAMADLTEDDLTWMTTVMPYFNLGMNVTDDNKDDVEYYNLLVPNGRLRNGHSDATEQMMPLLPRTDDGAWHDCQSFAVRHYYEPLMLPLMFDLNSYLGILSTQKWLAFSIENHVEHFDPPGSNEWWYDDKWYFYRYPFV